LEEGLADVGFAGEGIFGFVGECYVDVGGDQFVNLGTAVEGDGTGGVEARGANASRGRVESFF